jgi:hypothetical protein
VAPEVVAWTRRRHVLVAVSPLGTHASFHEAHRLLDSQTTLSTRLSLVRSRVLVPGCAASGPITLVAIEKLLELTVTVPGGSPVKEITVSVLVWLVRLEIHDPVQSVTI